MHVKIKEVRKEVRTADIRTIFMKTTEYIQPDTGKKLTGHYCLVCRYVLIPNLRAFSDILLRNKGLRPKAYFFSGGVSSLRTHIARYGIPPLINCDVVSVSNHPEGTRITSTFTRNNASN